MVCYLENKDLKNFSTIIWKDIVNSFDIGLTYDEMDDLSFFYHTINKKIIKRNEFKKTGVGIQYTI